MLSRGAPDLVPMLCASAACRLHLLTKHRVFSGPGFLVAQEIGDAAHGGQVAVSHDAWLELRNNMDQVPPCAAKCSDPLIPFVMLQTACITCCHPVVCATPARL